jgi:hypothetical protein
MAGGGLGGSSQGQVSPLAGANQISNMGMQLAKMGAAAPPMAPPMGHPMAPPGPIQGALPPQMMTGGMGLPGMGIGAQGMQGGLPWQALLARRGMM